VIIQILFLITIVLFFSNQYASTPQQKNPLMEEICQTLNYIIRYKKKKQFFNINNNDIYIPFFNNIKIKYVYILFYSI